MACASGPGVGAHPAGAVTVPVSLPQSGGAVACTATGAVTAGYGVVVVAVTIRTTVPGWAMALPWTVTVTVVLSWAGTVT